MDMEEQFEPEAHFEARMHDLIATWDEVMDDPDEDPAVKDALAEYTHDLDVFAFNTMRDGGDFCMACYCNQHQLCTGKRDPHTHILVLEDRIDHFACKGEGCACAMMEHTIP
jgi:hypothetical protein